MRLSESINSVKPSALKKGDAIGIVAPSSQKKYTHGCIYAHICRTNLKVYVGQTILGMKKRKKIGYHAKFKNALKKYAWNGFDTEILEYDVPIEKLDERETFWISFFDSYKNGYNCTLGGQKTRRGFKHSDETKEKCRISKIGFMNPMHGKKPWNYGLTHSEKDREKFKVVSRGRAKLIHQFSLDGEFITTFESLHDAERGGFDRRHIKSCALGETSTSDGFIWTFHKDEIEQKLRFAQSPRKDSISVEQLDDNLNIVRIWKSLTEAELSGFYMTSVRQSTKDGKKRLGWFWRIHEDK